MKSIFELTQPRPEVLQGHLSEDLFAARLHDVIERRGEPVYYEADRFFRNTYATAGLKTLLQEVIGRLTGQSATGNSILRLETSFGGGKTHNLIALYHAVSGATDPALLRSFLPNDWTLPQAGAVDVAGVVGSDLDPTIGVYHTADNITTYTLWGELAYQLGGIAGYTLARESDKNRSAPGTGLFESLIGNRPTLIMIDEIARHLRSAVAMPTANKQSNLADQTVAFLMSLMEFVAGKGHVVLVLTMASDSDAFRDESDQLKQALAEALRVSARQERVLTPTGENEIAAIVVHRLFETVDHAAAAPVISRYAAYYQELHAQNAPIHERARRSEYIAEFETAYPFHPELIRILNIKVATIPNFQRTRGALRLLATVVRRLWQAKPAQTWLIHPYHITLDHEWVLEELTSRLDRPKFKQVCEADIVSPHAGTRSHAEEADEPVVAAGKPPYARRLGTTIFMHSLMQGGATGVELPELLLAVLTPHSSGGDDAAVVVQSLDRLHDKAWFLEYDGYRHRFKTEPSLNKIIADEMEMVGPSTAKGEIDDRIRRIWRSGFLKPVFFPTTPNDVDDDAQKPKLAIMHYDAISAGAGQSAPPELVQKIYQYTGVQEAFRTYRNNVLFLVADTDQIDQMTTVTRRYLAIGRITGSAERMREFNEEYQKKLRKMGESAELEVRVAITKAYRHLYYPAADAPQAHANLRRELLAAQAQGDTDQDQTNVIIGVLHSLSKVKTADDPPLAAAYIKARAWDLNQVETTTDGLRRTFAKRITLPILLDINQLKRSIDNGVKQGIWLYYDSAEEFAYDADSPPKLWQIDDDARLYLPDEAARLQLRIKGKWQPPTPGDDDQAGEHDDDIPPFDDDEIDWTPGRPAQLTGQGIPNQAFQQVLDQAGEHAIVHIRRLDIRLQGSGKSRATDLRAIGLALPQFPSGARALSLSLTIEFDERKDETIHVTFKGGWERYKRLKQIADAFASEAHNLNVTLHLAVTFDQPVAPGHPLGEMRDVLQTMGVGHIQLIAYPAEDV